MATNKDIHIQFHQEKGLRVPQVISSGNDLHKYASELEYINWLEEKLIGEWKTQKK